MPLFAVTAAIALQVAFAPISSPVSDATPDERPRWNTPLIHSLALLSGMRAAETYLYPHPFGETREFGRHYLEAYTKPPLFDASEKPFQWDHDPWTINVFGHGLYGSEIYLRARSCRFDVLSALAFTTVASIAWEYGFEANGVRPSVLDLIYTPIAGLILGEARHWLWKRAGTFTSPFLRDVVRAVVDPVGEISSSCR